MDKAIEKKVPNEDSFFKARLMPAISSLLRFTELRKKAAPDEFSLARKELLQDIEDTLSDLRYARNCFETAKDPEVIEACIYEIKSAETRYSFLLRKAKLLSEKSYEAVQ